MMKKIVFFDIDGTLVDVRRGLFEPSNKTMYAIKQLINNDIIVFIASGRYKGTLHKSIKDLNPSGYILSNGGYIEYDKKVLFSKPFDIDIFNKLKNFSIEHECIFSGESIGFLYTPIINDKVRNFLKKWKLDNTDVRDSLNGEVFYKCCLYFNNHKEASVFEKEFEGIVDYRAQTADPDRLSYDINLNGVNKGKAVEEVLKRLDIDKENSYCFCDGSNDIELAKACRYSYAMANGDDELKKITYGVCDDVINDGVYYKLIELGLIKKMD